MNPKRHAVPIKKPNMVAFVLSRRGRLSHRPVSRGEGGPCCLEMAAVER
jgi:hypothetical protein